MAYAPFSSMDNRTHPCCCMIMFCSFKPLLPNAERTYLHNFVIVISASNSQTYSDIMSNIVLLAYSVMCPLYFVSRLD